MTETKTCEPHFALADEVEGDHLPDLPPLTSEQIAARKAAIEQYQLRREDWDAINQALRDNSMAVTRAMSRFHLRDEDRERATERALASYDDGSFLINRLGAEIVIDQDLAVVLLALRRRLIEEYGGGPAALMLTDRAVAAYQDFIRVEGWAGNLAIHIEHEFFGIQGPSANFQDRFGREGRSVRGLSVEQHLNPLRESLIPLAERCGRVMREALAGLEALNAAPSRAVERSRPTRISVRFE